MNVVLIIDDDWAIRELLTDILRAIQPALKVLSASNGQKGVALACSELPDLILLDGQMPIMNGSQVATTLRQTTATSKIPLVAMTGHDDNNPATADLYKLCDAWVTKPFSMDCLHHLIGHFFETTTQPAKRYNLHSFNSTARPSARA